MKIDSILAQRSSGVAFEFFPPKTESAAQALQQTVAQLRGYNPLYVSMTYGAGGSSQDNTTRAVDMLLTSPDLEIMPHLTCIGAQPEGLAHLLTHYQGQGIENIMALRGDPPQNAPRPATDGPLRHAIDLVRLVRRSNHFCIGVAVYPEGHIETADPDRDFQYTSEKLAAGADFAVTQMFFDNSYFYRMIDRLRRNRIAVPVLPGILPLTDVAKVKQFAAVCRTTIPDRIEREMERFSANPEDMAKAGLAFTIEQCRDLQKQGFTQLHFFTLNKPSIMQTILPALGFSGGTQ